MSRRTDEGEGTYGSVRDRFRQWREANPRRQSPSALGFPEVGEGTMRLMALAAGVGLGGLLLLLAATAYWAALSWADAERDGAVVAYALTGFFLTVAGLGAILATWNHLFRVLRAAPRHH
ncbi:MAG TPA: hypothetical protein VFX98_06740 [Longimicrobiaceae bacterium]|nr:hypothetical protein [Longimicrobiaceae bacterium]